MELRQLRYFVAVASHGSFLKAAASVHVAQSALSHQVAQLEQELDARLLHRLPRGVVLTDVGCVFLPHATAILRQAEDARASVKGLMNQPSGKVVFGLPPSICNVFALPLLQAVRKELPMVDFELTEELSGSLAAQLRSGELDLAVLLDDGELGAFRTSPLTSEQLLLISRPGAYSARSRKSITLKLALQMPLVLPRARQGVRPIIEAMAMRMGLPPPNVVSEINSVSILSTTVQAGIGLTVQAASAFKAELSSGLLVGVPITQPNLKRDLAICANKEVPMSTASQAVSRLAIQVAQSLVSSGEWPFANCQDRT